MRIGLGSARRIGGRTAARWARAGWRAGSLGEGGLAGRAYHRGEMVTAERSRPPLHGADQEIRFCRSADGTRLAYAVHGSGPPLVVASCWLSHLQHDWRSPVWRHFLDDLGAIATVVRYDERGFGMSDWDVDDFSLEPGWATSRRSSTRSGSTGSRSSACRAARPSRWPTRSPTRSA